MREQGLKCIFCGGQLCWDSDFDASEVHGAEECDGGIVGYYHCMKCVREYEISDPVREERDTTFKEYWHG